jgi:hypothetical protein
MGSMKLMESFIPLPKKGRSWLNVVNCYFNVFDEDYETIDHAALLVYL